MANELKIGEKGKIVRIGHKLTQPNLQNVFQPKICTQHKWDYTSKIVECT
jgi:hypothetical protein